jgi:hypothetical protein
MTTDPPAPTPPPPATPSPAGLIFDWRHRPRTWPRLSFWLLLVLAVHLAGFILFRVHTPAPARAMPVPATLVLTPPRDSDTDDLSGPPPPLGQLSSAEVADLDLPEQAPPLKHVPSFAEHAIARQPWPSRPERAAWPEVSGVSKPVLPPAQPSAPSEGAVAPPR